MTANSIIPEKNYRLVSDGFVFTGAQVLSFMDLFWPGGIIQGAILRSALETDEPATDPDSEYGVKYDELPLTPTVAEILAREGTNARYDD